ncbi:MAG: hypothetical protein ACYDG2_04705, partial [Ruminiclostridium sp.]
MITNMTFGECLKYMLSALDISINRLSKAINVDSSLVNRWIHGTRIPAYHTPYIESIIEYLSKNIQNSFQVQHLNELYLNLNVCEDHNLIYCNKEKIRITLLEAQGYSIECEKSKRKRNKDSSANKKQMSKSLNNYQQDIAREVYTIDETHVSNTPNLIDFIALSNNDKIIFGTKNIISSAVSLLEAALKKECKDNKMIYITFNNDLDIESNSCDELVYLKDLLLKALINEWHVLILFSFNNNIDRTLRFINFVLPLLKTGRLDIYYFKKYGTNATEREIYVISEIGALSCFSTKPHSKINCAFYFENKVAIDVFKDYFNVLLTNCSQPLIKYFSQKNISDYNHCVIENEESLGNRVLFEYCFSISILPKNLYEKLLKRKNASNDEMLKELNFYKRRLNAFLLNIQNYEYRDIYFADSILNLIEHRQYCYYSDTGIEIMDLDIQNIIEYLQNIIRLLETYDNYNIAFIPRNSDSTVKIDDYYFLVKERQTVLLGIYEPSKSMPEVRLLIDEPMFVQAF